MQLAVYTASPKANARVTPILFVHGAWHGAWCWQSKYFDFFVERGYTVHALDLRAHGASPGREHLRSMRISDYCADVAQVAAMLPTAPIVIGHSMGGLVTQKYLEKHVAPAAALMCSVPPQGALSATLRYARKHPSEFIKGNLTLSLYPFVNPPHLARELFFSSNISDEEFARYAPQIQNESFAAFLDMVVFALPHPARIKTPVLVLGAAQDQIFTPAEVRATAEAYHTTATIFPDSGHDLMLDQDWRGAAETIAAWLDERRLA